MKLKHLLIALAALLLIGGFAAGQRPDAPDSDASADRPLSESYLLKQIQLSLATDIAQQTGWFIGHQDDDFLIDCAPDGDRWTVDNQAIWFGNPDRPCLGIRFSDPHYTDDTQLVYGTPRVVTGAFQNKQGEAQRIDAREHPDGDAHKVSKSFEISQSVESSFAQDFSFDVTLQNETEVEAGSAEAGGKFEDKLTATFGTHFGTQRSKTEAQATDQVDTIEDEFPVAGGSDTLVTFSNAPITEHVPFAVDGYYDFGIEMIIPGFWDWAYGGDDGRYHNPTWRTCFATAENPGWKSGQHVREYWDVAEGVGPTTYLQFDSLANLMDIWWGVSTDWPLLGRDHDCVPTWWDDAATQGNLTAIESQDRRKIVLSGTQTRKSSTATTMTITDLSDCGDDVADGIASDAENAGFDPGTYECTEITATKPAERAPVPMPDPTPTPTPTPDPNLTGVGRGHCCTDCASADCIACCAFYGGCCGS